MRVSRRLAAAVAVLAVGAAALPAAVVAAPLPEAAACPMFPADSYWHADISQLPRDGRSDTYVASVGTTSTLKADFGAGLWDGGPIGIPYTVVSGSQAKVPVTFDYADESDPGPYPVPANALIEGGPSSTGDRHVLVVDKDACRLYEMWDSHRQADGSWHAGSGATWSLTSNALRPSGWTSADAAGLPILPGLVRYDQVASGRIDHAIRVTVPRTDRRFIWPARHQAGVANDTYPPMGLRFRLKASFDISGFSPANQVILRALQTYGMIVADNGSPWFLSGVPDERWNNDDLHRLRTIAGSNFEAVDASSLMVDPNSGAVRTTPKTATATALASSPNPSTAGQAVTFTASVSPSSATGTVRFDDGATPLATVALKAGTASLSTSSLVAGTHPVKATYLGDATHASSTSSPVSHVVNGVAASLRVTAPNGGEQWSRRVNNSIRWSYAGLSGGSVRIQLLRDGAVVSTIALSAPLGSGGSGSYSWRPGNRLAGGGGYTVRVSVVGSTLADTSDAPFSIT